MIHIITTGGTIEGLEYEKEENTPRSTSIKIEDFLKTPKLSFDFEIDEAFSKDSRFITFQDRTQLVEKIEQSKEEKILITHGTKTMIETAKFLGQLNLEKTIVLVGAFILGTNKNTDAHFNLGYAICALQFLNRGVYIAMNGGIIAWTNVLKIESANQFMFKS